MKLIDLIQHYWPLAVAVGAVGSAFTVFLRDALTIRKLEQEIKALQAADEAKKSRIVAATSEEIERYSARYPQIVMHLAQPPLRIRLLESFGVLLFAIAVSILVGVIVLLSFFLSSVAVIVPYAYGAFAFVFLTAFFIALLDLAVTRRSITKLERALNETNHNVASPCAASQPLDGCDD